ncbi:hypothetical protein BG004_005771 [Podila humilis]|nr:hypothetical protein BG004_005771 [Podila humilis]
MHSETASADHEYHHQQRPQRQQRQQYSQQQQDHQHQQHQYQQQQQQQQHQQHQQHRHTPAPEEDEAPRKPRVIIAGAGIGGLFLGLLLHKAKIPFLILEKTHEIKPLGSAMVLGTGIAATFEQLGIYSDFMRMGKPDTETSMYNEDLKLLWKMEYSWLEKITKRREYVISRPDLYSLLWSHIPREYIALGKRILSFKQSEENITVKTSDGGSYSADILVGCDGAYSAVRQQLYRHLKDEGKLPASDDVPLPYSCVCLVGQTHVLDPEEFPDLISTSSQHASILGKENMCTWLTFTTRQNTVCWMVIQFLTKETAKTNDSFRNSEWGPEAAEAMCKEVRHFKVPGGRTGSLTLGEYIDRSPKEYISKVMLEEKVFQTWYGGRTVLLGDACHKLNPTSAAGAITAIHDAVTLANWLVTLKSTKVSELESVFNEYYNERLPVAKEAFETGQIFTKTLGKSTMSVVVRACMKRIPSWLWKRLMIKMSVVRHQVSFLPLVEDHATVKPLYQPSLHKSLDILEARGIVQKTGASRPKVSAATI